CLLCSGGPFGGSYGRRRVLSTALPSRIRPPEIEKCPDWTTGAASKRADTRPFATSMRASPAPARGATARSRSVRIAAEVPRAAGMAGMVSRGPRECPGAAVGGPALVRSRAICYGLSTDGRDRRRPRSATRSERMASPPDEEYFRWTAELFDRAKVFDKPDALAGIRVLELTTLILGPSTADFLGEFGAEVIKVELPPAGDTMRYVTPRGTFWQNASLGFFPENHSKYHVGIDLHKEEGKGLFKQLAARADVFVENFRAGTLDRWGIGYRDLSALNPRLVYVANSGFGQWGPFALGRASYDAVAQTVSGMIGITGFPGRPPITCGIFLGDWFGAMLAATAALVALHHRRRTGQGQLIDYAQSEGLIRSLDWTWLLHGLTGESRGPAGNRDRAL